MARFDYVATDNLGKRSTGAVYASDEKAAIEKLRKDHDIVISVTREVKARGKFLNKPHLSLEEKMMFTKHLATMLRVGITLTEAIEILEEQSSTKNNRLMFKNILEMIRSGQTLSKSLNEYSSVFPDVFVNMVAVGEENGTLEQVLGYLGNQLEKQYELRKKVVSAFIYPAVIVFVTILLMGGIIVFIMPKITDVFTSFDVTLPLPTRILIGISTFISDKPLLALLLLSVGTAFLVVLFKVKFLKPIWHRFMLHLPVFGNLLKYSNQALFCRTMNSLLQAGVPVTKALDITGRVVTSHSYRKAIIETRKMVEKGGKLGEGLEKYPRLFPPITTKMMIIGETTGSLEAATDHLALLYERNVDNLVRNLSVLLEPLLLVLMGAMIGGVALSIILPIYQLPNLISR